MLCALHLVAHLGHRSQNRHNHGHPAGHVPAGRLAGALPAQHRSVPVAARMSLQTRSRLHSDAACGSGMRAGRVPVGRPQYAGPAELEAGSVPGVSEFQLLIARGQFEDRAQLAGGCRYANAS